MAAHLANQSTSEIGNSKTELLNVVEPLYLSDVFLKNPPNGFTAFEIQFDGVRTPAFQANFDLLTTVDDLAMKKVLSKIPFSKLFLSYPTVFLGTTATEYSIYPDLQNYDGFIAALLHETRKRKAQLCIVKDVPQQSPLLSAHENERAAHFSKKLTDAGFNLVEGQALAYVPIDFQSVDEYLQRMSKSRRKEFRKKLRESSHVDVEELQCGASQFFEESFLAILYEMYLSVFKQSEIHFDLLTPGFFRDLLQDANGGGRVFFYRIDGRLIGYNICFVEKNRLVDKYIGFVYPEAREANLYFISWFKNLEYALKHGLSMYIAGWTDPIVKASLGARFTMTMHLVYFRSSLLRSIIRPIKHIFESDAERVAEYPALNGSDQ